MYRPDLKIGALSTFLQYLDKLGTDGKQLRYFRGHSKQSFQVTPSIFRNPGWISNEASMLKELLLRCPNDFAGSPTTFQCLVKMQHYGLPTRLLDITSNPLVALYFACETHDNDDEDGEVVIFDYDVGDVKYFDSDTVSVIANLSRRPSDFKVPTIASTPTATHTDAVKSFNEQDAVRLLLHDIGNDKPHFLPKILRDDLMRVVCVKPLLNNPRIIRQEGAFLLYGCNILKREPAQLLDHVISGRFTINRDEKQRLLDQLRTLGISRATMFPEIEHVAKQVKHEYLTRSISLSDLKPVQRRIVEILQNSVPLTVLDLVSRLNLSSRVVTQALSDIRRLGGIESIGSGRHLQWRLTERDEIVDDVE